MAIIYTYFTKSNTNSPQLIAPSAWDMRYYFDYTYTQNVANNSSTITVKAYADFRMDTNIIYSVNNGYSLGATIGGFTHSATEANRSKYANEVVLVGTWSRTFTHNSDGTKSIYLQGYGYDWGAGGQNQQYTNNTLVTFPTIPRYTSITAYTVTAPTTLGRISASWSVSNTCDLVEYSLNSGSWTTAQTGDRTSGSFNIDGLTPNTSYSLKIRVRRKDSQLYTESAVQNVTTTNIATLTAPSANFNFNLGSNLAVSFTNPSGSTVNLRLESGGSTRLTRSGITSPYTLVLSQAEINTLYGLSPTSNDVSVRVVIDTVASTTYHNWRDGTAKIVNQTPTWTGYNYVENTISNSILGTNQVLIQNNNSLVITCNQATAPTGTTMQKYQAIIGGNTYETTNLITRQITINNVSLSGNLSCVVNAIDNRGNFSSETKTITVLAYTNPTMPTLTLTRQNNYDAPTSLVLSGNINRLLYNSANRNSVLELKYRWRVVGGSWSSYTNLLTQGTYWYNTTSGNYGLNSFVLRNFDTDKTYNLEFVIIDKLKTMTFASTLQNGQPLVSYRKGMVGINKVPTSGALDVNGNTTISGTATISGNTTISGTTNLSLVDVSGRIRSAGSFNKGGWNAPTLGALTQIIDNSGSQHSVLTGIREDNGARLYGIDWLDSYTNTNMRLYAGSNYLNIGSAFTINGNNISTLQLGTTSSTAFRGDYGNTLYSSRIVAHTNSSTAGYIRFDNGMQICWGYNTTTGNTTSVWGATYWANRAFTFAGAFSETPTIIPASIRASGTVTYAGVRDVSSTACDIYILSNASTGVGYAQYLAIGRWK
jgi:hypothetical protein